MTVHERYSFFIAQPDSKFCSLFRSVSYRSLSSPWSKRSPFSSRHPWLPDLLLLQHGLPNPPLKSSASLSKSSHRLQKLFLHTRRQSQVSSSLSHVAPNHPDQRQCSSLVMWPGLNNRAEQSQGGQGEENCEGGDGGSHPSAQGRLA